MKNEESRRLIKWKKVKESVGWMWQRGLRTVLMGINRENGR
jgi:hypothetical protein